MQSSRELEKDCSAPQTDIQLAKVQAKEVSPMNDGLLKLRIKLGRPHPGSKQETRQLCLALMRESCTATAECPTALLASSKQRQIADERASTSFPEVIPVDEHLCILGVHAMLEEVLELIRGW